MFSDVALSDFNVNLNSNDWNFTFFRQDILLFSHSTPVKPDHVLDRLMEKLDLTGLVGSPPAECLPPSGKSFVQILLMFEV